MSAALSFPPPVVIRGLQRDQVVIVDGIRHEVRGVDEDGPCWCPVGVSTEEGFRALLWEEVEEIAPGRWRTLASVMEAARDGAAVDAMAFAAKVRAAMTTPQVLGIAERVCALGDEG